MKVVLGDGVQGDGGFGVCVNGVIDFGDSFYLMRF